MRLRCSPVWADTASKLVGAVNAALILEADHDLSSATFAARIAASAGTRLHACVVGAPAMHLRLLHCSETSVLLDV